MAQEESVMQQTTELVSKSIITPSMLETQRIVFLKQDLENALGYDFRVPAYREKLIRLIRVLYKEMLYTLTPAEITQLEGCIKELQDLGIRLNNLELRTPLRSSVGMAVVMNNANEYPNALADFLDCAYDFLGLWNAAGVNHGLLGSKTKKQISEFRKVYSTLEAPNVFFNKFGLPVSMETEFYARCLVQRTYAKWDNIIFIQGKPGVGKDTVADSIATTMASISEVHQYSLENIFFKEGIPIVEERIKNADPFTIFKLSEAGNQLDTRDRYEKDNIVFTRIINWIRNSGLTVFILWKEMVALDSSLRKNRAINTITVKHRGTATVKTFNENPYATEAIYSPKYLKKKVVLNTQKASLMQLADPTTLMQLPILNIDNTDWWQKQELKKNEGKKAFMGITGPIKPGKDVIPVFLKALKGARIVEKQHLDAFNTKNSTMITLQQVADFLAEKTGVDKNLFIVAPAYVLLPTEAQKWLKT